MRTLNLNSGDPRRALRFAVVGNLVPIAIATAIDFGSHPPIFFVGAIGASIAPIVVTSVSRSHPVPFYLAAFGGIPALTMMQADSGGAASGYSVLVMMAMIWFGLQATDRELFVGFGVLAACSYLPMLIFGPPAYPVEWGHATLLVIVGTTVAGSLRAMSRETMRLTERLRRQAVTDALTGLLNRRGWVDAAERELARVTRTAGASGLIMLDLDSLKRVNDTKGHDEGDRLLCETGERMRAVLRQADILGRLGGDEFVAMLPDGSLEQVSAAAERLRAATPALAGFSAGLAVWDGTEDLDALLRRADLALYAAKAGAGGAIEIAPASLGPADEAATAPVPANYVVDGGVGDIP